MQTEDNFRGGGEILITTLYLSKLDKTQLIDLLQHKTQLLVSASLGHLVDHDYTDNLRREVEQIQSEIWVRDI